MVQLSMAFYEHTTRSVLKAITYRFIILISDGIIIFAITHRYDTTAQVIIFSNIASTILYVVHERLWNKIHWGKSHRRAEKRRTWGGTSQKNSNRQLAVFWFFSA